MGRFKEKQMDSLEQYSDCRNNVQACQPQVGPLEWQTGMHYHCEGRPIADCRFGSFRGEIHLP